ncbi:MAG: hypothetical protein HQK51_14660 [Oligoflexia bacterium]|nr:hypothetical protein [Oligoflexia bacterium]
MKNKILSSEPNPDLLRDQWESLGIAFSVNSTKTKHADPERTLIKTIQEFQESRKMLRLVLAWLDEYGELIHVERLRALMKELSAINLSWLGGISNYMVQKGDLRWRAIEQVVREHFGNPTPKFSTSKLDELQAQRVGEDQNFKKYGLTIAVTEAADSKKLLPFSTTIRSNLWLRMRTLFGTNWRADMASVLLLALASNPYQAERILGCAKETAYRNWKSLKEADVEDLLKGAA